MILRAVFRAAVVALAMVAGAIPHAQASPDPCRADDDINGPITALPRVAEALQAGGTLRVLAVGSATMFGPDATLQPGTLTSQAFSHAQGATIPVQHEITSHGTDAAFPRRMADALQKSYPGLKVDVVLRGGRGLSAGEMLDLIRMELKAEQFQLVLWQTGTVEAVRNTPPGEFAETLSDGAEAVEAANANLVLIDPQYSRFLQTNSNLDPYAQALQQTASIPGVALFHRYDLMRAWVNDGQIDLERTARADRLKTVELLHQCLGAHLARLVMAGAHS